MSTASFTPSTIWTVDSERMIVIGNGHMLFESKSGPGWHAVELTNGAAACSCIGFSCRKRCRHARAAERLLRGEAVVRVDAEGQDAA